MDNRDNPILNNSDLEIRLSPQPVPPPVAKNSRQRKKGNMPQVTAANALLEKLMADPTQRRLVLQILDNNKELLEKLQKVPNGPLSSSIDKIKKMKPLESPTALRKHKQMMKQRNLEAAAANGVNLFEEKVNSIALTPSKRVPKKILLKGVHAFVSISGASKLDESQGVKELLQSMGATVAPKLSSNCTHVIFKNGSYECFKKAKALKVPLVSILWLDAMDRTGYKIPADMYPALGDTSDAKKTTDALCERLINKCHSMGASMGLNGNTLHQEASYSSNTNDSSDINFKKLQAMDDEDSEDVIEGSQPESGCILVFNMTKQKTIIDTADKSDPKSNSVLDELSNKPSVSGFQSQKTNPVLEASPKLSETLLNSPFINTARRTQHAAVESLSKSMYCSEELENIPPINNLHNKGSCKTNLFKDMIKHKMTFSDKTGSTETVDLPTMSTSTEPSTTMQTRRRTLLHPESLGIVDDAEHFSLPMGLMDVNNSPGKKLSKTGKRNVATPLARRKTKHSSVAMDITPNVTEVLPTSDTLLIIKSNEQEMRNINSKNTLGAIVDRTSISSTNTSKSDDLMSFKARRITRRMSALLSKVITPDMKEEKAVTRTLEPDLCVNKETNQSSCNLTLRISDGSAINIAQVPNSKETQIVLDKMIEADLEKGNDGRVSNASSARTSASEDLMAYTTKRVTHRTSSAIRKQADNQLDIRETDESPLQLRISNSATIVISSMSPNSSKLAKVQQIESTVAKKRPSGTKIFSQMTESTSSPTSLSLRLSSTSADAGSSDKSTRSSGEGLSPTGDVVNQPVQSEKKTIVLRKISVSPVSNLSEQLSHATISLNAIVQSPLAASACDPASMLANTIGTASTSYSIVDYSAESSRGDQTTRSKSGNPSLITNIETTDTTASAKDSTSSKRKLFNPDDAIDTPICETEAEERRWRTDAEKQRKSSVDTARRALKQRLESLNIPSKLQMTDDTDTTRAMDMDNNDSDFESPMMSTQRTQRTQRALRTQTQSTQSQKMKYIVCTRFHNKDIAKFHAIVSELGEFRIEQDVTARTTHLVALEASRTLNFLRAMSRGIWILRRDWLFDSKEAGKWLEEDSYEMTEFSRLVQELRLQRESFGKAFSHDVFINCDIMFISPNSHPRPKDLEELIHLCKGEITTDLDEAKLIIGRIQSADQSQILNESQINVVESWILDCITFGRIKKFHKYLIQ